MRIENAINDAVDYFMENPRRSSTGLPSQTDVRLVLNDLVGEEGYGRASQSASVKKVMVRLKKLSKNLLMENPRRVRRNQSTRDFYGDVYIGKKKVDTVFMRSVLQGSKKERELDVMDELLSMPNSYKLAWVRKPNGLYDVRKGFRVRET